jgi:hypothetical protein
MLTPISTSNWDGTRKAQHWRSPRDGVSVNRSLRAGNDLAGHLDAPLTAFADPDHRPVAVRPKAGLLS